MWVSNQLKMMEKKKGSLARRKNTFEKKMGLYRVLLGHPSPGLTRQAGTDKYA